MRFVVDASIAVKWYIPEIGSQDAAFFLTEAQNNNWALSAPDLILTEIANVFWKKNRKNELSAWEAAEAGGVIAEAFPAKIMNSRLLMPAALEVAIATGITAYDSLYLVLAVLHEARLVTADNRLVNTVNASALRGKAVLLTELFSR